MSAAAVGTALRPNLFVVGAPKAGTTALWRHLDHHPEIFMSKVKEPHYFSPGRRLADVVRDPAAYARLFAESGECRFAGEASATYLADPGAARRIQKAVGSARILVSLRDPVERAYASYWTSVRIGTETGSFEQAVREELAGGRDDLFSVPPPHIARGFYAEQLERYLEIFGDSVLVLMFDELEHDTRAAMRRIYAWLDLDPAAADSLDPAPVFPFELPRSDTARLALAVPGVRQLGDRVFRGRLRERVLRLVFDREKPPLDPETRSLLREVYASPDERLRRLLGRPLPWDGRE